MKFWVDNIYKSFEVFFLEKKPKIEQLNEKLDRMQGEKEKTILKC